MPQTTVEVWTRESTPLQSRVTCVTCDDTYVALGYADGSIELRAILQNSTVFRTTPDEQDSVDHLHMTLDRLIVCSTDCYIVDMSDVPNGSSVHEHTLLNVEELTELNGCRSICASTSPNNTLAVAYGKSIVVSGMDGTATALLEGHTAAVACLTFSSVWEETLISGSHDRTFRLWDLQHNTVKYESRILSAAPLLSLCEQRSPHRISLGFGDGVVRIVSGDEGYKVLREINSAKLMPPDTVEPTQRKVARVSSHPRIVEEIGDGVVADTEKGFSVLSLQCVRGVFLVSTNHALFSIGCSSLEGKLLLSGAGSGMPYEHAAVAHPYLVGVAAFTSALTCHHIHLDTDALLPEQNTEANPLVSVFPREELPKCFFAYSSIFKNTGVLSGPTHGTARRPSAKKGNGNVGNASKIKSSGYAAPKNEPWSVQQSRKKAELQKRRKAAATQRSVGDLVYTAMRGAPCVVQKQHAAPFESCPLHNGAVMAMQYTPDAKHLVTASADQLCCAVRLPVAKYSGEAVAMKGHTAPLTSVGVSHSYGVEQQALITGSLDSTAKLWRPTRSTSPYLTLQKQAEVRACCFMHTDRVAVVASGGNIDFHHFFIDSAVDESDRLTNRSCEKLILQIKTGCQAVTSLAAHNSFMSGLVFYAGSNKTVSVHDVAAERSVRNMEGCHERPVQHIVLPGASMFADIPRQSLEIFGTTAPDGAIKLWDVRAGGGAVRTYVSHLNKVHSIDAAISPCLRFLASGSEDRCVYTYDLASGKVLSKTQTHRDVVSAVAWSPLFPQLAAGGHDGKIAFLSDK